MTELYKVSQSKVSCWRTCRRRFWYRYVEKLKKKTKARPLKFGDIMHQMIEVDARGQDPFRRLNKIAKDQRKMFAAEKELYGDIIEDLDYIMTAYFAYYEDEPIEWIKHNGEVSEHEFEIEIADGILAKGKIDGFAIYKKMHSLVEHKGHARFPKMEHRWRNVQSAVYVRFVDMLGWFQLDGVLWNYVKNKSPTKPQLLKSGELSTRKIDSLPDVVVDIIKANKLNPADYQEFIATQQEKLPEWFTRVYTPVRKRVVDQIFKDFVQTSQEMADISHKRKERNIGLHCTSCEFEGICAASLSGKDEDYVIEKEFVCTVDEEADEYPEETVAA